MSLEAVRDCPLTYLELLDAYAIANSHPNPNP
jgi:hypothetical protein